MRYVRAEIVAWLESQGCQLSGEPVPGGLAFYSPDEMPFVIPDPDDDGFLDVNLVEMVLADRWIASGTYRPRKV